MSGENSKRRQRDFYEREGANSKRMQRDFYERVGQILRECNVISTNGVRMEWEA